MIQPDERVFTLHVAKVNVVLAALGLVQSIAAEIVSQAAEQERTARLANGPDLATDRQVPSRAENVE